ncbi:High-affinity nicotinic acid transporter [Diatrype stigma]|uniref:High-affinity nicotinic acid transporter n=1 Tax=Diatrype stigma TaxID=117547 RepID=A0AAN9UMS5_9PEZI
MAANAGQAQARSLPPSKVSSESDKQAVAEHESTGLPAAGDAAAADPAEIKKIIRKIDYRLIPLLAFLYMLTFLDRVNIGNARLWNMERDLGMAGYDYNIAVLVTRVLIGFFEAGMFPGCMFLISAWYRRKEMLSRMAFFLVANDVAGTISGLLGAGLGALDGVGGYSGWSWIFFIEGAITCFAAVLAWFFVPHFPEKATFLQPSEKEWILRRLRADDREFAHEKMARKGVLEALRDWKVLTSGVLYLAVCTTAYAISVFQPTILATFGWSSIKSNLLSAPPRVASAIVSVLCGIWSDRVQRRGIFCLGGFGLSTAGLIIIAVLRDDLRYIGIYFAAIGIYICQPLAIAWT